MEPDKYFIIASYTLTDGEATAGSNQPDLDYFLLRYLSYNIPVRAVAFKTNHLHKTKPPTDYTSFDRSVSFTCWYNFGYLGD